MKKNILWIEDKAFIELESFAGPVYSSGKYNLITALDVSSGIQYILNNNFDAIIVDIRIPPGDLPEWKKLFNEKGGSKSTVKLGIHFLYTLLNPISALIKISKIPEWITPDKIGILSVEKIESIKEDIEKLKIKHYKQKTPDISYYALLNLIEEIITAN